jgi:hypothetical protein
MILNACCIYEKLHSCYITYILFTTASITQEEEMNHFHWQTSFALIKILRRSAGLTFTYIVIRLHCCVGQQW